MNKAGFTLLEVLLSIAIVASIAGISVPVYQSLQTRNDLDIAAVSIVQDMRQAQVLSQSVDDDMGWGIKIQSGSIVVFKGANYTARQLAFDEVSDMPTSITPSGSTEIVFAKLTGLPQATGTITLTSSANETRTITINTKGMVNY